MLDALLKALRAAAENGRYRAADEPDGSANDRANRTAKTKPCERPAGTRLKNSANLSASGRSFGRR